MQNMIDSIREAELAAETQERETAAQCTKMVSDAKEQAKLLLAQRTKEAQSAADARLAAAAEEKNRREAEAAKEAASLEQELRTAAQARESEAIAHILSQLFRT